MPGEGICARKVFRAPWATRAECIRNLKLFFNVDPFSIFELHIATGDEECLTTNVITLPVPLKVVCVLASHKVAGSIFDSLDETTLARLGTRSRWDRMRATEGAVLCFDLVGPWVTRVTSVAGLVVLLIVGPSGELFIARTTFGADITAWELEYTRLHLLLWLLLLVVGLGMMMVVMMVVVVVVDIGLALLVCNFDTRSFSVESTTRIRLLWSRTHWRVS